ncbi:MAG: hypothetical protein N2643_01465 [Endomicrobia bacterium]|nr:hypothetical protein [Endomicrobiia bacterium]
MNKIFRVLLYNKIVKFIYGIILLPFCWVIFKTLIFVVTNAELKDKYIITFFIGMIAYIIFHFVLYKPVRFYVIGHELVHAISAYLCGAKVKKIKINSSYGTVNVNKVNSFIALSPYFVPFYSIILALLWIVLKNLLKLNIPQEIFVFLLGFTIMFHLVLTIYAIYLGQKDLEIPGWLFSIVIIFIVNCLLFIGLFIFVFPSKLNFVELKRYVSKELFVSYKNIYLKLRDGLPILVEKVKSI